MLSIHQGTPNDPETILAIFPEGSRLVGQYRIEGTLPSSLGLDEQIFRLTLNDLETTKTYTIKLDLCKRSAGRNETTEDQTASNVRDALIASLTDDDWTLLQSYFSSELIRYYNTPSRLISNEDITYDFAETAGGDMVMYADLGEQAQSVLLKSDDDLFLLQDHYCANTDCDCRNSQLAIFKIITSEDGKPISHSSVAEVVYSWLEPSKNQVSNLSRGKGIPSSKKLIEIIDQPKIREILEARYKQIRSAKSTYLDHNNFQTEDEFYSYYAKRFERFPAPGHEIKTIKHDGPKVGRNDSCPCGSKRKYKKCCGK